MPPTSSAPETGIFRIVETITFFADALFPYIPCKP